MVLSLVLQGLCIALARNGHTPTPNGAAEQQQLIDAGTKRLLKQ
jgi:hypothetical protein